MKWRAFLSLFCLIVIFHQSICQKAGDVIEVDEKDPSSETTETGEAEVITVSGQQGGTDGGDDGEDNVVEVNTKKEEGDFSLSEDDDWQPRFCLMSGMECAGHDLPESPLNAANDNECLLLCVERDGCRGAHFRSGQCWLKDHRCSKDELIPRPDGKDYWRKVFSDPGCPDGRGPVGIKEEGWTDKYCEAVGKFCSAEVLKEGLATTGFECMGQCTRLIGCRSAHYKEWNCKLMKLRCADEQLLSLPGGVQYYRLEEGEECSPGRPKFVSSRKDWSGKYCYKTDKVCEGHDIYRNPQKIESAEKCLKKCNRVEGCQAAAYKAGLCYMKNYRCSVEELEVADGFIDFYRLRNDEDDCPDDRESGSPPTLWSASFCKAKNKRCSESEAMSGSPISLKSGECVTDCLSHCAVKAHCASAFYDLKEKTCYLSRDRCDAEDLKPYVDGSDYYRLEKGEECPKDRAKNEGEWDGRFCYTPNKNCPLTKIGGAEITTSNFMGCLRRCVDVDGCVDVTYTGDVCVLLSERCEPEQLVDAEGTNNYRRLLSDEEGCPDGRQPKLPTCPKNSEYSEETPGCPATCRDSEPSQESCEFEVSAGCLCNEGFALADNNTCIPLDECNCYDEDGQERYVDNEWMSPDCSKQFVCQARKDNSPEVRETGLGCPENSVCDSTGLHTKCSCLPGYKSDDGQCNPYFPCGKNSYYEPEASACKNTCTHRQAEAVCEEKTKVVACVCEPGFVFDELEEACVPEGNCGCVLDGKVLPIGQKWMADDCKQLYECRLSESGPEVVTEDHCCPDNSVCTSENGAPECQCLEGFEQQEDGSCTPPVECPENSEFVDNVGCPNTCENRTAALTCTAEPEPGCKCLDGFVLKEGKCVGPEECGCVDEFGNVTKVGDKWNECEAEYECASLDGEPTIVKSGNTCPPRAFCKDDECVCENPFVKDPNGNCVPDYKCPENSDYTPNVTACPDTCRQPTASQSCQVPPTEPGCQCREGFVQNDDGDCVTLPECPCYDKEGMPKDVGDVWTNTECNVEYSCVDGSPPRVNERPLECGEHATCRGINEYEAECPCDEGYVRVESGKCERDNTCDWHEHVAVNGTCPQTCSDPRAQLGCDEQERVDECACNEGYLLNKEGKCVAAATCGCFDEVANVTRKVGDEWNPECNVYEVCELDSDGNPKITRTVHDCPENSHCEKNDCVCDEGFIEQVDGSCTKPEPEEPKCDEPSVYSFSAPPVSCENTCRYPTRADTCEEPTRPGCMCPPTHLLNDTGVCVPKPECPCYDEKMEPRKVGEEWVSKDCETKSACEAQGEDVPKLVETEYDCPEEPCPEGTERQPDGSCKAPEDCVEEPPKLIAVVQKLFIYRLPELFGKECSNNSKLISDASACPNTCANPVASETCDLPPVTACECHPGHLLDHVISQCIPIASCGCYDSFGTPHPMGDKWYSADCKKLYTCGVEERLPTILNEEVSCTRCERDANNLPFCADEGAPSVGSVAISTETSD